MPRFFGLDHDVLGTALRPRFFGLDHGDLGAPRFHGLDQSCARILSSMFFEILKTPNTFLNHVDEKVLMTFDIHQSDANPKVRTR